MNEQEFKKLQPNVRFDEAFSARLRASLVKPEEPVILVSPMQDIPAPIQSPFTKFLSLDYFNSRLMSGAAGAFIAMIIIAPLTYVLTKRAEIGTPLPFESYVKNGSSKVSLKQQINSKGTNAFGTLSYVASGRGGGNAAGNSAMAKSDTAVPTAIVPDATSSSQVYKYTGAEIKLTETEGKVFKRVKGLESTKQLNEVVHNGKFALTNLGSFSNLNLQNIQLSENKPFGYIIGVNFEEGMININQNWAQWNMSAERTPLPASQAPGDATIIALADEFIKTHGIDISVYGKPIVENKTYDTFDEKGKKIVFVQEQVIVTYPLLIDGLEVYDEGGYVYGLQIGVDVREKKVASVNNLTSQIYESSPYALETDAKKLIQMSTSTTSKTAVTLDTPRRVLMRNNDFYVPALLFPVTSQSQTSQTRLVVPLLKDALSSFKGVQEPINAPSLEDDPATTTDSAPGTTTPQQPLEPVYPDAVVNARRHLAADLTVQSDTIKVEYFTETEWPNACLGYPKQDEACAEVVTHGYRIIFTYGGAQYEYHTDKEGTNFRVK